MIGVEKNTGNKEAVTDAYKAFTDGGYNGSEDDFKNLLSTNEEALKDAHKIFVDGGYDGDVSSFEQLMGIVKKKETEQSESDGTGEEQPTLSDTEEQKKTQPADSSVSDDKKVKTEKSDSASFKQGIFSIESKGTADPYKAQNPDSSAAGKYQFLWDDHGDKIKKHTGVKNKEEYLNNPEAQEKFMDHWIETELKPSAKHIKDTLPEKSKEYTDEEIMALVHFQGLPNAKKFLKTGKMAGEDINVTVKDYLKKFNEGLMEPVAEETKTIPGLSKTATNVTNKQATNPDADKINIEKYGAITDVIMNSAEEEVAPFLNETYGNMGLYFEEDGISNEIKVVSPNMNKFININLKDEDPAVRAAERQKLITFMEANKVDEKEYLKYKPEYDRLMKAAKLTPEQRLEIDEELEEEFEESGFKDTIGKFYNSIKKDVDDAEKGSWDDKGDTVRWIFSKLGDYETYRQEAVGKAEKELRQELGGETPSQEQIIERAKKIRKQELIDAKREYNMTEFLDDLADWGEVPLAEKQYKHALNMYSVGAAFQKNKALKASAVKAQEAFTNFKKANDKYNSDIEAINKMPEGEEREAAIKTLSGDYNNILKLQAEGLDAQKELSDNQQDIQDFADEADLFRREYGQITNLAAGFAATTLDLGVGIYKTVKDISEMPMHLANYVVENIASGTGTDLSEPGMLASLNDFFDTTIKSGATEDEMLNKLSDFINKDIRGNVRKARSTDDLSSMTDWMQWTGDLFASQAPQLAMISAMGPTGLYALAGSAYGNKLQEMQKEARISKKEYDAKVKELNALPKDSEEYKKKQKEVEKAKEGVYDFWQMRGAAAMVGLAEYASEKVTLGIIKRAMPSNRMYSAFAKANKGKVADDFVMGVKGNLREQFKKVKGAAIDFYDEGASEVFAQVAGNLADKYVLGKDDVNILDGVKDAFLAGGFIGAGINVAGGSVGMIVKPWVKDAKTISNNLQEINTLTDQITKERQKPKKEQNKELLDQLTSAVAQIEYKNGQSILDGLASMNRLSVEEIREVSKAEDAILKEKEKYKKTQERQDISQAAKDVLLKQIDADYNEIVKKKADIMEKAESTEPRYIINDQDVSAEEFQNFVKEEGNLEKLAKGEGYAKVINDEVVQKEFIDNIKPIQDAIQKRSTEEVDAREQARDGEAVGARDTQQETTQEGEVEVQEQDVEQEEVRFRKKKVDKEVEEAKQHEDFVVSQISYEKKPIKKPIFGIRRQQTFTKVIPEKLYRFNKDKVTDALKKWAKKNEKFSDAGSVAITGQELIDLGLAKKMPPKEIYEMDFAKGLYAVKFKKGKKVSWKKLPQGKGDPSISSRNPKVKQAAESYYQGKINYKKYLDIINKESPVEPITEFFEPATDAEMKTALDKAGKQDKQKALLNEKVEEGARVALRLDIPSYQRNNTWVVSVHDGTSKGGKVKSYMNVAKIKNVDFSTVPKAALNIARGKVSKTTIARMHGDFVEIKGKNSAQKAETAKNEIQQIVNDKNWVQVGMNPFRHSFFYDRATGQPVVKADEVIQIGGLVYAKNVEYAEKESDFFKTTDAQGKTIYFKKQERDDEPRSEVEIITEEINKMDDITIDEVPYDQLKDKGTIDPKTFKRKGLVKDPKLVNIKDFANMPMMVTISDELTSGEVTNPETGEVIKNLKGGLMLNYIEGMDEYAWAYTNKRVTEDTFNTAKKIYKENEAIFDKLWKEGKLPDQHIPVAVVKMGKDAMKSNEAMIRQLVQNLATFPAKNKAAAYKALLPDIKALRATVVKRIKKKEKEGKKVPQADKTYVKKYDDIIDFLGKNKTFDEVLDNITDLNIGVRPLLINRFTTGKMDFVPTKFKVVTKPSKALVKGLDNSEIRKIHLGNVATTLAEPALENVPDRHIMSFIGIDISSDGPMQVDTHPNYPWVLKGQGLGIVKDTAHLGQAMPAAYANVIDKLRQAQEQGKDVAMGNIIRDAFPNALNHDLIKGRPLTTREDDAMRVIAALQLAFPKSQFFTDQVTWEEMMATPNVKKRVSDGETVYGFTTKGDVYLNPKFMDFNTPIHEAGHLWVDFIEQSNPDLLNKGLNLVEGTKELQEAIEMYGDNVYARKEALAVLIGNKGETIVQGAQKAKFQNWLTALMEYIKTKFPSLRALSVEQIENLTLQEFIGGAVKDVLGGKPITKEKVLPKTPEVQARKKAKQYKNKIEEVVAKALQAKGRIKKDKDYIAMSQAQKNRTMFAATKAFLQETEWYKKADDIQKEAAVEALRLKLKIKRPKAPKVEELLGVIETFQESIQQQAEIKWQLKLKQAERLDIKSMQTQLTNFIRKMLPTGVYGKEAVNRLTALVRDSNNIEKLDAAMDEIVTLAISQVTKETSAKLDDLIKKPLTKTESNRLKGRDLSPRVQDMMSIIKDVYNKIHEGGKLKAPNEIEGILAPIKKRIAKAKTLTKLSTKELDTLAALELAVEYADGMSLETGTVAKMQDLLEVVENIKELREQGRSERREAAAKRSEMYSKEIAEVYKDITGKNIDELDDAAKEIQEAKLETKRKKRAKSFFKRMFAKINEFFIRGYSLPYIVDIISKSAGKLMGGKMQELLTDRINEAGRNFDRRMLDINLLMSQKLEEIYGKKWKSEVEKNRKLEVLKGVEKADGTPYEFSQDTMYYLYNQYKDPANHAAFEATFKSKYKEVMEAIEKQLDPKVKEWADWQVNVLFPSLYPEYNKTYKDIYGTNMPQHLNYAGRLYRTGVDKADYDLLNDNAQFQTSIGAASTFERQQNKKPIDISINGNDALMTYLTDMEHWNTHARTIKNVDKIISNQDIKTAIELNDGPEVLKLLEHSIKMIARRGVMQGSSIKMVNTLTDVFVLSRLGINPTVGLKQLTSAFTYSNDIGLTNWLKYGVSGIGEVRSIWKEIRDNSSYIQRRYDTDIRKTIESYSESQMKKLVPGTSYSKALDMMMYFVKAGDKGGIMGGIPNYRYYKAEFKKKNPNATEQEAIDYAIKKFEKDTKNTQQSSDIVDKDFYQTHSGYRWLNVFKTAPRQYQRKVEQSLRQLSRALRGKEYKGTKGKLLYQFAMYHAFLPVVFQWVSAGLPGLLVDFDEEDAEDLGRAALIGNLNSLFILGDFIRAMADTIQDKPWARDIDIGPLSTIMSEIGEPFSKLQKAETDDEKYEAWMELFIGLTQAAALPTKNIARWVKNINKVITGDVKDPREAILRTMNFSDYVVTDGEESKGSISPFFQKKKRVPQRRRRRSTFRRRRRRRGF